MRSGVQTQIKSKEAIDVTGILEVYRQLQILSQLFIAYKNTFVADRNPWSSNQLNNIHFPLLAK